ncbi:ATP-grasp domain-containing protein [Candidatus Halobonum tyrrellensis]|uniref:RimK domain protein ATP-grasp n=1 Tax=Candidatus Halobonum tyrrellensis G22 TaxID=1324957 RepID=V4HC37_9EURY|nr:ATP-grasp domain-containing protein [Candidatus Halobonum tyrrellensis]ESP87618.1 RimK domain protein ATP-grasp [Candidatus Halobonum tyrrellensis G22]
MPTADPDLRLAVTTDAETFERLRGLLPDRGIAVEYVQPDERVHPLTAGAGDAGLPDADVGWVYPSRLMEGAVVDARLGVPWVNGRDVVLASRNKAGVIARLADAGVSVPDTAMVSNPADEAEVLAAAERVGYPLVVKPNSTTRGVGIASVSDPDSLLGVTDYLDLVHDYRATGDKSYLLQEFLPDARDYRVMVLDGSYAGAVERRLPDAERAAGRWKHNVHRGAVAERVDPPAEARATAERAAATLDAPLLGVDLLVSEGRLVVSETNARPTVDAAEKYEPGFLDGLEALVRRTAAE